MYVILEWQQKIPHSLIILAYKVDDVGTFYEGIFKLRLDFISNETIYDLFIGIYLRQWHMVTKQFQISDGEG